ncbi:unnamed protein product [Arctogadus glacialis]
METGWSESAVIEERLTGFQVPSPVTSTGNVFSLRLTSDFAVSAHGFKLNYEATPGGMAGHRFSDWILIRQTWMGSGLDLAASSNLPSNLRLSRTVSPTALHSYPIGFNPNRLCPAASASPPLANHSRHAAQQPRPRQTAFVPQEGQCKAHRLPAEPKGCGRDVHKISGSLLAPHQKQGPRAWGHVYLQS